MKKFLLIVICLIMITPTIRVNAASVLQKSVKVGLVSKYNNVDKVYITNKQVIVGYESNGDYFEGTRIVADSDFYMTTTDLYYIKIDQGFTTYNEAKIFADSLAGQGYSAVPCNTGTALWMVYIGGYTSESQATNAYMSFNSSVVPLNKIGVILMDGQKPVAIFHNAEKFPQVAGGNLDLIELDQNKYRGTIEFSRHSGKLTAVNVLTMDEYLYGVIPSEMPASWHIEALKAQAVTARSYAVTRSGVHSGSGYDLCDSNHCQIYKGASAEMESTNRAVLETSGKLAYYNGEIINAVYFSSSGGTTENSENVWPEMVPYLRSVTEINETTARMWTRTFTLADINSLLISNGINIGTALDIKIGSFTVANRVAELVIVGTNGTTVIEKEQIRSFFSKSTEGSLESTNFIISNTLTDTAHTSLNVLDSNTLREVEIRSLYAISDSSTSVNLSSNAQVVVMGESQVTEYSLSITTVKGTESGDVYVFEGKGYGHGVGMSQHGANGMAQLGYTYEQILKYYYTDIEVR